MSNINPIILAGSGGGGSIIVREYTSGATWTKPSGLLYAWVVCVGAGGGGGSGRRGAASSARGGASGAAGGVLNIGVFAPSQLSDNHSISIGAGGNGGAAVSNNSTNGNHGNAGGDTSFGNLVLAKGGVRGNAGTASTAGVSSRNLISGGYPNMGVECASGSQGNVSSVGSTTLGSFYANGAGGGAGGGCISSGNAPFDGGMVLSGRYLDGTTIPTRDGGGVGENGSDGTDDMCLQVFPMLNNNVLSLTRGIGNGGGTGGGPGDTAGTVPAGRGGHGGRCCGGGGGGGSTNGANSGAGGNGGNGLCIVIEFY